MTKLRTTDFKQMKRDGDKIAMITAYDAEIAGIVDIAGVDIVLVGDSLGNVIQGESDTLSVTVEHMIYHTSIVSRAVTRAHVSADMPFMSYQASKQEALRNAGRLIKEGRAESVKLEMSEEYADTLHAITRAGIPVIAHIGLCPQSLHVMGGYRIQGRTEEEAQKLIETARISVDAGAFLIVLESIPENLAEKITRIVDIPTVGIGAGRKCDGQVLVFNDMIGLSTDPVPRFVKKYTEARKLFIESTKNFVDDVKRSKFPGRDNVYE